MPQCLSQRIGPGNDTRVKNFLIDLFQTESDLYCIRHSLKLAHVLWERVVSVVKHVLVESRPLGRAVVGKHDRVIERVVTECRVSIWVLNAAP